MSVNQIIASLQEVFLEQTHGLERSSGFCQRQSRLSAAAFVQGLVFGWLSEPNASLSALARAMAVAGSPVSPQAVQQRFTPASVTLLRQVLAALMQHERDTYFPQQDTSAQEDPLTEEQTSLSSASWLAGFSRIWVRDSTVVTLPKEMHEVWPGCGGATGVSAGLKVSVLWDWQRGALAPFHITPASVNDQSVILERPSFEAAQGWEQQGEMHLFDLGYFCLEWMEQLHRQGDFFCCRYKAGTLVYTSPHQWQALSLVQQLAQVPASQSHCQWSVWLGRKQRLPCRLIARRVPQSVALERRAALQALCKRKRRALSRERLELCEWNLWLTNAPPERLDGSQVEVLYRVRWQIERLFRLWKETLHLDEWRSRKPERILCEIYAKLIGAWLTQQLTAFGQWQALDRSLVHCAHAIMRQAMALLTHLRSKGALRTTLLALRRACQGAAKVQTRRRKPATFQRIQQAQQILSLMPVGGYSRRPYAALLLCVQRSQRPARGEGAGCPEVPVGVSARQRFGRTVVGRNSSDASRPGRRHRRVFHAALRTWGLRGGGERTVP